MGNYGGSRRNLYSQHACREFCLSPSARGPGWEDILYDPNNPAPAVNVWVLSIQPPRSSRLAFHNKCVCGGHHTHARSLRPWWTCWKLHHITSYGESWRGLPSWRQGHGKWIIMPQTHWKFWTGMVDISNKKVIDNPITPAPWDISCWMLMDGMWYWSRCHYPIAYGAPKWLVRKRSLPLTPALNWWSYASRSHPCCLW